MIDSLIKQIDREIEKSLPPHSQKEWLEQVAGTPCSIDNYTQIDNFTAPGRDLLSRGGKRWRPLVMVLTCQAYGGGLSALPLTPLVELPHNGSLIVDDIEDASEERRGKPAVHLLHGVDLSINAGNLMYFHPTYLIDEADLPSDQKLLLYKGYCEDLRRLHLGQGLDIWWHNHHEEVPPVHEYLQMCRFKTGSLSRMSGRLGALVAGKSQEVALESASIWEDVGVGFQIADDIINLTTGNPGKGRGDDIVEGKKSLPVILHYQKSPQTQKRMASLFKDAQELGIDDGRPAIEEAIDLIDESGSLREAEKMGRELLESAVDRLNSTLPSLTGESAQAKEALVTMISQFLKN